MTDQYDVAIVGARCAGSPLATLLARAGVKVAVLEQATFPRDTLSTHGMQAPGVTFLDRLGVTEQIKATGARYVNRLDMRLEDLCLRTQLPLRPGDVGGLTSVRRFLLDPILADTASAAGADLRMDAKVIGLTEDKGRVTGVRVSSGGSEHTVNARLVVGADGRNSTIAKLTGARKYNLTPNERIAYWSFFEGVDVGADPEVIFHRWGERLVLGFPADSGLYVVIVIPGKNELPKYRADLEGAFLEHARACEPVAAVIDNAKRVGRIFGIVHFEGFFREASGPGWVLVGDSGHFKDPTPGWGIGDAFRQVESVAPRIVETLSADLDGAMRAWGRWRDEDARQHYWLATDLGKAGPLPAPMIEAVTRLFAKGKTNDFIEVFFHRAMPFDVITRRRVVAATGRLLAAGKTSRRDVLRQMGGLLSDDVRRGRLDRRPAYAEGAAIAAETEVD